MEPISPTIKLRNTRNSGWYSRGHSKLLDSSRILLPSVPHLNTNADNFTHWETWGIVRSSRWSRGAVVRSAHGEFGRLSPWRTRRRSRRRCSRRPWRSTGRRNSGKCQRTELPRRRVWSPGQTCYTRGTSTSRARANSSREAISRCTYVKLL